MEARDGMHMHQGAKRGAKDGAKGAKATSDVDERAQKTAEVDDGVGGYAGITDKGTTAADAEGTSNEINQGGLRGEGESIPVISPSPSGPSVASAAAVVSAAAVASAVLSRVVTEDDIPSVVLSRMTEIDMVQQYMMQQSKQHSSRNTSPAPATEKLILEKGPWSEDRGQKILTEKKKLVW
jgi:hypothetical protein